MNINIIQIVILIAFTLSCVLIYKFWKMALLGEVPQSPAAIGTGIAASSFLLAISLFSAWYVDLNVNIFFQTSFPIYLFLSVPILLSSLTLAGFLATKTSEDTSKMNMKLLIVLGFIPHFLVSIIAFMILPSWIHYLDFGVYIPAIIAGRILYLRMTNKALNTQASPAGTPQRASH